MNVNPHIYIPFYQSNLLKYLPPTPVSYSNMKYFNCNRGLEQPGSKTCEHNVVAICEWSHTNDKQRTLLADDDVTPS